MATNPIIDTDEIVRISSVVQADKYITDNENKNEDERRLELLGYKQEVKRIFGRFTNFGLTASMISVLLGVVPLSSFELQSGGPTVMVWSWIIVGVFTILLVSSLGEICSAFPTMGALYYWAFVLGGPEWGPFASWLAGWTNLLGQIAGKFLILKLFIFFIIVIVFVCYLGCVHHLISIHISRHHLFE